MIVTINNWWVVLCYFSARACTDWNWNNCWLVSLFIWNCVYVVSLFIHLRFNVLHVLIEFDLSVNKILTRPLCFLQNSDVFIIFMIIMGYATILHPVRYTYYILLYRALAFVPISFSLLRFFSCFFSRCTIEHTNK